MLTLSEIEANDVHQWLNQGWFLSTREGAKGPHKFGGVEADMLVGKHVNGPVRTFSRSAGDTWAHWPRCGAINVGNFAVFVERRPARQYRRTYNARCLEIVIPRKWEAMKMYGAVVREMTPDSIEVVSAVFNPSYPDLDSAMADLRRGTAFSRAINWYMVLTLADNGQVLVYNRGDMVGWIDGMTFVPTLESAPMSRRIAKLFNGRIIT